MRQPFSVKNIVGGDTCSLGALAILQGPRQARLHHFIRLILCRRTPENDDEEKDKDVPASSTLPIIYRADLIGLLLAGRSPSFLFHISSFETFA